MHISREMRQAWQGFARQDAMFFIHSGREKWRREEFFATGAEDVAELMSWVASDVRRNRMLEIGCGIGRLTHAFARHFTRVDAVDISPDMIALARSLEPPENVRFSLVSGDGLPELGTFDFVASRSVFQHVPSDAVIAAYLRAIANCLTSSGAALLHFDTMRRPLARRFVYLLPDRLLPATSRRFMRRYPRRPADVAALFHRAGLRVGWERGVGTQYHYVYALPPQTAPA